MTPAPRLLIRLGSLGDVVLATAAANALRSRWGDGCVDVLVKEEWAPIWHHHPAVRNLLVLSRRDRGLMGLDRWARRLREARYLEVVDLQSSPRTRFFRTWSGWRTVRRPQTHALRRRLLVRFHRGGPPAGFRMVDAFVKATATGVTAHPSLHPGAQAHARAENLLGARAAPIGLAPGARHATKRWPLGRYVELGRFLVGRGWGPVPVFFGPDEGRVLAAWRARWPGDGTWIPVREDLEVTSACLARVGALVTNDTGLMHMAMAMGTPVAAIFGPTVRRFGFAPAGDRAQVVEVADLSCRPCTLHGGPRCPREHFRCMLDLDVGTVARAADTALRSRKDGVFLSR